MKVGLIGLPGSGKTTIFNLLTGLDRPMGAHAPQGDNVGMVKVSDPRMDHLCEVFQPKKSVRISMELHDFPATFEGSFKGSGEILAAMREMDALLHVVRVFQDPHYPYCKPVADPLRDIRKVDSELFLADLDIIEKRIEKLSGHSSKAKEEREKELKELDLLNRIRTEIMAERPLHGFPLHGDEEVLIRGYCFLTLKPALLVLSLDEEAEAPSLPAESREVFPVYAKLEREIMELPEGERREYEGELGLKEERRDALVTAAFRQMNLISFFTIGKDGKEEIWAWALRQGEPAIEAAGKIHSDMARGFIRAEVIPYESFQKVGSMKEVKNQNLHRLEGKEYIVQDGDIITFRFSV